MAAGLAANVAGNTGAQSEQAIGPPLSPVCNSQLLACFPSADMSVAHYCTRDATLVTQMEAADMCAGWQDEDVAAENFVLLSWVAGQ
jgi:hypothetical protein